MKLSIVGTGYVGLITGACFAEYGNNVTCIDSDSNKIDSLNSNNIPIYEPGLDKFIANNQNKGTLLFSTEIKEGIQSSDFCFICVGTPDLGNGDADLRYVYSVAEDIGEYINHPMIIVIKSTVPVGTADRVKNIIAGKIKTRGDGDTIDFHVVSNPEFLKEGDAIKDCMRPDRVIVGSSSHDAIKKMHELYKPFILNNDAFLTMNNRSAEMTKYAANAMLATKISFMNELSAICEETGSDINKVRVGIGSDSRIGYSFIYAGCGYGGSCFPKDVKSLISVAEKAGCSPKILKAVEDVNLQQKKWISNRVIEHFGNDLTGLKFAVWGLSFKPNTDDMREAPSITTIEELTSRGAAIVAYDPQAIDEARNHYLKDNPLVSYGLDKYNILDDVDALILVTEWGEFKSPDFSMMADRMKNQVIFDGRNQYDTETLENLGFKHYQVGVGDPQ